MDANLPKAPQKVHRFSWRVMKLRVASSRRGGLGPPGGFPRSM